MIAQGNSGIHFMYTYLYVHLFIPHCWTQKRSICMDLSRLRFGSAYSSRYRSRFSFLLQRVSNYLSLGDFKRLDGCPPSYLYYSHKYHTPRRVKRFVGPSLITQRPSPGNSYQLQSNSLDGFRGQVVIRHLLTYTRPRLRQESGI